jgi:hypothetical protein
MLRRNRGKERYRGYRRILGRRKAELDRGRPITKVKMASTERGGGSMEWGKYWSDTALRE